MKGARRADRSEKRSKHRAYSDIMRASKSRSRNKSSRSRSSGAGNIGNIINRVFDSSGPEGKVRGTPQQIIDKYNQLARDAQLSGDRVAAENFQQHAEHYLRLLSSAQKELEARREQQERQNRERQAERDRERARRQERELNGGALVEEEDRQPSGVIDSGQETESTLVETPESRSESPAPAAEKPRRSRKPRTPKQPPETPSADPQPSESAQSGGPAQPEETSAADKSGPAGADGSGPQEAAE